MTDKMRAMIARINAAFERENREADLLRDGDDYYARELVAGAAEAYAKRMLAKQAPSSHNGRIKTR